MHSVVPAIDKFGRCRKSGRGRAKPASVGLSPSVVVAGRKGGRPKLEVLKETAARTEEDLMRLVGAALAVSVLVTGCVSGSESQGRPPNYVASQAYQSPAFRNDNFGGAALPMRGLPH
jgi:hypothetical protein